MDMESNDVGFTFSDMFLETWYSSDMSTGYLEDAIADWTCRQKNEHPSSYLHGDVMIDCSKNCGCLHDPNPAITFLNDNCLAMPCLTDYPKISGGSQFTTEEAMHADKNERDAYLSYTSSSMWQFSKGSDNIDTSSISKDPSQTKKVVYPFELVKPGGVEGELTLRDINHKMLMRPSKPIPHPVEVAADLCSGPPPCISPSGLGLSGKTITALTKIHTQGKGTITIIRTKD